MGCSCDESVLIICYLRTSPDDVVPEVWLCGDLQNGPQKKLEVFSTLSLPIRSVTPSPDSSQTMPADEPSAFDVIPGETSDRIAFLSEPWAVELSKHHHFKLAFSGSYYIASMVGRTALTVIPTSSASNSGDIDIVFSNNHGTRRRGTVKSCYLFPARLSRVTKDLEVAVLHGERRGQTFRVRSLNKKLETCKLLATDRRQCEERFVNICIVLPHKREGCECAM